MEVFYTFLGVSQGENTLWYTAGDSTLHSSITCIRNTHRNTCPIPRPVVMINVSEFRGKKIKEIFKFQKQSKISTFKSMDDFIELYIIIKLI